MVLLLFEWLIVTIDLCCHSFIRYETLNCLNSSRDNYVTFLNLLEKLNALISLKAFQVCLSNEIIEVLFYATLDRRLQSRSDLRAEELEITGIFSSSSCLSHSFNCVNDHLDVSDSFIYRKSNELLGLYDFLHVVNCGELILYSEYLYLTISQKIICPFTI